MGSLCWSAAAGCRARYKVSVFSRHRPPGGALFGDGALCALQRGKREGKHVSHARARGHRFSFFAFTASPTLRNLLRLRALGVKVFVFLPSPFAVCGGDASNACEGAQGRGENTGQQVKPSEGKGEGKAFTRNALCINRLGRVVKG